MKINSRFLAAALSACLFSASFQAIASTKVTLHVAAKPQFTAQAVKDAQKLGTVAHVDAKKGTFDLIVTSGKSPTSILATLWKNRAIFSVTGDGLPTEVRDLGSLHYLGEELAKFPKEEREDHFGKPFKPEEEGKDEGPDYLRSLQYFTARRAYPFDRVDWDAYPIAHEHAAKMTPAFWMAASGSRNRTTGRIQAQTADPLTASWSFIGPKNLDIPYQTYYGVPPLTGRTNAVAYDPSHAGTYYAGGAEGGLWKSTDSGATWTSLSSKWAVECVGAITLDPNNSQIIYVGTGDQHGYLNFSEGIEKSTDGGRTWTLLGKSTFGTSPVTGIAVDPNNSQHVVASVGFNGGVYRSADGGLTWNNVLNDNGSSFYDLSVGVAASQNGTPVMYAVDGNLWKSTDFGQTWTEASAGMDSNGYGYWSVAASKTNPNTVYVLDNSTNDILKSTNSGSSFSSITGNLNNFADWNQSWYDYYLRCGNKSGSDDLFCGLIGIYENVGGGTSWTDVGLTEQSNALTHNDAHCFAFNPSNSNQILFGNDGGVFSGSRSGSTWTLTPLNHGGIGLTMFYDARWSKQHANVMLGGSQDNATPVATGDLNNWGNKAGGDGGGVVIDKDNDQIQYGTVYNFDIVQTTDGWNTQNDISPNVGSDSQPFVTRIFGDPVDGDLVYGCTNYLWRWDNSTQAWTPRLGGQSLTSGNLINTVGIAPSNNSVIYTGSDSGDVYRSTNKGSSWTKINTSSLPNRAITSISVNPSNPYDILVGLSGTGTGHLYECTNTQAGTPSYTSVSGSGGSSLPNISLNCIERDPNDPVNTIYVGTDVGVFATNNAGANWYNATIPLGLPSVQVNALEVTPFGVLNAATYGRGMWQIHLTSTGSINPTAATVLVGTQTGGTISSLYTNDGNVFSINDAAVPSLGNESALRLTYQIPSGKSATVLKLSFNATASHNGRVEVLVYNSSRRRYVYAGMATSGRDQTIILPGAASQYVNSSGQVAVVLRTEVVGESNTVTSSVSYDHATLTASTY